MSAVAVLAVASAALLAIDPLRLAQRPGDVANAPGPAPSFEDRGASRPNVDEGEPTSGPAQPLASAADARAVAFGYHALLRSPGIGYGDDYQGFVSKGKTWILTYMDGPFSLKYLEETIDMRRAQLAEVTALLARTPQHLRRRIEGLKKAREGLEAEISSLERELERQRQGGRNYTIELTVQTRNGVLEVSNVAGAFAGEESAAILKYREPLKEIPQHGVELRPVGEINAYETPGFFETAGFWIGAIGSADQRCVASAVDESGDVVFKSAPFVVESPQTEEARDDSIIAWYRSSSIGVAGQKLKWLAQCEPVR